jgi:hypothetical protein
MMTTQYYPVLQVRDVANTAAFYVRHFDFVPMFPPQRGIRVDFPPPARHGARGFRKAGKTTS